VLADKCFNLLEKEGPKMIDDYSYKVFGARSKAIKGLVELIRGDIESGGLIVHLLPILSSFISFSLLTVDSWL